MNTPPPVWVTVQHQLWLLGQLKIWILWKASPKKTRSAQRALIGRKRRWFNFFVSCKQMWIFMEKERETNEIQAFHWTERHCDSIFHLPQEGNCTSDKHVGRRLALTKYHSRWTSLWSTDTTHHCLAWLFSRSEAIQEERKRPCFFPRGRSKGMMPIHGHGWGPGRQGGLLRWRQVRSQTQHKPLSTNLSDEEVAPQHAE